MRVVAIIACVFLVACGGNGGDDAPPIDAGIDGAPVCTGGPLGYLDACTMAPGECGSCVCHSFGHSQICTITCIDNPDCPPPSAGCAGGFCRP